MKFLFHSNCTDGSGAALAAWLRYGNDGHDYIPVQYGSPPPDNLENQEVFILDFSYKRDVMIELGKIAGHVTVIDHHKTAEEDLREPISSVTRIFNMKKSGAMLSWEYFHPSKIAPELFKLIQDRDLWQFKLEHTKDAITGLKLLPDWRTWTPYLHNCSDLIQNGAAINFFLKNESDKIIANPPAIWDITGDTVPVYNLPGFMISDTLHRALVKYPQCDYAVAFIVLKDRTIYSLRSRNGTDTDVSEIAKQFCGGGHKHAAGFSLTVIQKEQLYCENHLVRNP